MLRTVVSISLRLLSHGHAVAEYFAAYHYRQREPLCDGKPVIADSPTSMKVHYELN